MHCNSEDDKKYNHEAFTTYPVMNRNYSSDVKITTNKKCTRKLKMSVKWLNRYTEVDKKNLKNKKNGGSKQPLFAKVIC